MGTDLGKMGETFFFKCNLLETHLDRSSVLRVEIGKVWRARHAAKKHHYVKFPYIVVWY